MFSKIRYFIAAFILCSLVLAPSAFADGKTSITGSGKAGVDLNVYEDGIGGSGSSALEAHALAGSGNNAILFDVDGRFLFMSGNIEQNQLSFGGGGGLGWGGKITGEHGDYVLSGAVGAGRMQKGQSANLPVSTKSNTVSGLMLKGRFNAEIIREIMELELSGRTIIDGQHYANHAVVGLPLSIPNSAISDLHLKFVPYVELNNMKTEQGKESSIDIGGKAVVVF
jgi:hypothetical protein